MSNTRPNWLLDQGSYLKYLLSEERPSATVPFTEAGTPPPPPGPKEGGLAKWFAQEGNMNMLGTAATGVNIVTGLAGALSNLETAGKQQKLLDQQLAHNKSLIGNRKQLVNQLQGSY